MLGKTIIVALFVACAAMTHAADDSLADRANAAYQAQDWNTALSLYRDQVKACWFDLAGDWVVCKTVYAACLGTCLGASIGREPA